MNINRDAIAEPLYTLLGEIFDLRGVFRWLRRSLITFVQITYGRTINRFVHTFKSNSLNLYNVSQSYVDPYITQSYKIIELLHIFYIYSSNKFRNFLLFLSLLSSY